MCAFRCLVYLVFSVMDEWTYLKLVRNVYVKTKNISVSGPLVGRQIFRFSEEGLVNARFDYSYNNFRVTSMQAMINETPLPIDLYRYVDVSGRVEQFGKFSVINYDLNQVITTHAMKHTKIFNAYGQVIEVQYEILKSIAYWMTVHYDNMGRTVVCDIRVGVDGNITRFQYEYDADSQLQSVLMNERPQWRYSYDLNGNINLLSHGTSARLTPLRYDLRDRITRLGEVQYKMDEDGFLRVRGNDIFEYNSNGLLTRVYNKVTEESVHYSYDGLSRRVASRWGRSSYYTYDVILQLLLRSVTLPPEENASLHRINFSAFMEHLGTV